MNRNIMLAAAIISAAMLSGCKQDAPVKKGANTTATKTTIKRAAINGEWQADDVVFGKTGAKIHAYVSDGYVGLTLVENRKAIGRAMGLFQFEKQGSRPVQFEASPVGGINIESATVEPGNDRLAMAINGKPVKFERYVPPAEDREQIAADPGKDTPGKERPGNISSGKK